MPVISKKSLKIFLFSAPLAAQATSLDVNVGNETVGLAYMGALSNSELNVNIAGMHHQDDRDVLTAGISVVEYVDRESHIGLGANLYTFDTPEIDGNGIALGGFFRQDLGLVPHLGLGAQAYFGPSIVSMDSADDFLDATLRLEYQLIQQANIYVGYRKIKVYLDDETKAKTLSDGNIDSSWILGLRMVF